MSRLLPFAATTPLPPRIRTAIPPPEQEQLSMLVNDIQILVLRRPVMFQIIAHFAHRCRLGVSLEDNGTN